ncbi:MAG: START domain-containing protein [Bacteroidota bacterium]
MKLYFFTAIIFSASLAAVAQPDCTLKTDKDGIKVYTCLLKNSKYKAVKSTFEINCTLSEFAAAILDVPNHDQWEYKTIHSKVLKKISEHEIIYYIEGVAPVLTSNRDFVIKLDLDQNTKTKDLTIDLVSIPDYIPPTPDIVRVPFSKAYYKVKALAPGTIQVEYYIEIDLGGSVAPWMVNMVADKAPYETFKGLRKIIGNYKGKGTSFIKN